MSVPDHVRPLSVGEILDLALRRYRAHLRPLFLLMLTLQLPLYVARKGTEAFLGRAVPVDVLTGADPEAAARAIPLLLALIPLALWVTFLLLALAQGAVMVAGERAWLAHPVRYRDAFAALWPRLPALFFTAFLVELGLTTGALLGTLPGIGLVVLSVSRASPTLAFGGLLVAGLGGLGVWLVLFLRWYLVIPVVVLETRSGLSALRRSVSLMRGSVERGLFGLVKIRATLLLLVLTVVLIVPSGLVFVPKLALAAAFTPEGLLPSPHLVPFFVGLPLEAAEVLLSAVLNPFGFLAGLFFYLDLRVRKEGYDLELRAGALS